MLVRAPSRWWRPLFHLPSKSVMTYEKIIGHKEKEAANLIRADEMSNDSKEHVHPSARFLGRDKTYLS
jgi:hypothetical protein